MGAWLNQGAEVSHKERLGAASMRGQQGAREMPHPSPHGNWLGRDDMTGFKPCAWQVYEATLLLLDRGIDTSFLKSHGQSPDTQPGKGARQSSPKVRLSSDVAEPL